MRQFQLARTIISTTFFFLYQQNLHPRRTGKTEKGWRKIPNHADTNLFTIFQVWTAFFFTSSAILRSRVYEDVLNVLGGVGFSMCYEILLEKTLETKLTDNRLKFCNELHGEAKTLRFSIFQYSDIDLDRYFSHKMLVTNILILNP